MNTQLLVTEESACCLHRRFMNLPGSLDMLVSIWRFYRNRPRPCRQKGSWPAGFLPAAAVAATMLINTPTRYQTVQKMFLGSLGGSLKINSYILGLIYVSPK